MFESVEGMHVEFLKIRCMLCRGVLEDERLEGFKQVEMPLFLLQYNSALTHN